MAVSPHLPREKPGGHGLGRWVSELLVERSGGARFPVWLRCELLAH